MITTPTVLILGAGASMPYGFPSSEGLRKQIIESVVGERSLETVAKAICKHGNIDEDKFIEFRNVFLRSGISSIDSFLSKRSEYVHIGKYAISVLLCAKESKEIFSNLSIEDDWYKTLWNALITGVTSIDEFRSNKIKTLHLTMTVH